MQCRARSCSPRQAPRRRWPVLVGLVLVVVVCVAGAAARATTAEAAVPVIYRLTGTAGATKVLSVTSNGWSDTTAMAILWERNADGVGWRQVGGPWLANVGYGGWAYAPGESTGRSPIGSFTFGTGFGTGQNPGYRLGWFDIGPTDYWVEDPAAGPAYNAHQQGPANSAQAPWGHFERLADYPVLYQYAALINFNVPATGTGRGSGIFLHASSGGWTAGCVALPVPQLVQTLRWIDPGTRIVMGPLSEVTRGPATAIEAAWWNSPVDLGAPTTPEWPTPTRPGAFRHFERGSIYWSAATGAREVHGAIRDRWQETGWEQGPLGLPTTDEIATPDGIGRYNHFEQGSIYWSPSRGAHRVVGVLRSEWAALGWEQGRLGYPTAEPVTSNAGTHQRFAGGVVFVPVSGAATVAFVPTAAEQRTEAVTALYQGALGRLVDAAGLSYWTGLLARGMRFDDVAAAVWSSSEAYQRAGGADAAWVSALYPALLGRLSDPGGVAAWILVAGSDRPGVVRAIYNSAESASRRVEVAYLATLARLPDPAGRAYWQGRIAVLGDAQLRAALGSSAEAFDLMLIQLGAG